jgi:hypothetical protein
VMNTGAAPPVPAALDRSRILPCAAAISSRTPAAEERSLTRPRAATTARGMALLRSLTLPRATAFG